MGFQYRKLYFQPDVNLDLAIAQIVAATNAIRALLPVGIEPPIIVQYNASSVPVLQLTLTSNNLNEQQLYDYGIYRLRQQLAPVPGVTFPTPDGGKYRQIMVDIDPLKLASKGLTPLDVVNAVNAQNLTLPSGQAKIGDTQYTVRTNVMPTTIEELNNIPIRFTSDATVFLKDVGQVRDGSAVQQNVVREDGKRAVLLIVIKNGNASTLAVVNGVRKVLQIARQAAPPGMSINELFDQSKLVTASILSLLREGSNRRGPNRADDPAVSWVMALDRDRHDLYPAIHPDFDRRAVFYGRNDQHHDARRSCARGRHPGRRLDCHDRKYASTTHRGGRATAAGDP